MKTWITKACIVAGLAIAGQTQAQSLGSTYRTALGVKFWPAGITVKHFVKNNRALEGIGYFWNHGFRFTGLYEFHGDINGAPGLKWYAGPGFHTGVYNDRWGYYKRRGDRYYYYEEGDFSLGVDGVLGLDYKFKGAPINISLDIQPYVELVGSPHMDVWGGAAVRFTF